jgi:hypothetical protein
MKHRFFCPQMAQIFADSFAIYLRQSVKSADAFAVKIIS